MRVPWVFRFPDNFPNCWFLRRNRDHQRSSTLSIYAAPANGFYDVQRSTEHEIDEVLGFRSFINRSSDICLRICSVGPLRALGTVRPTVIVIFQSMAEQPTLSILVRTRVAISEIG